MIAEAVATEATKAVALKILDIVLTAAANDMAQNFSVSDVLKAAHAEGHQISDEDLAKYVIAGSESLQALSAINAKRRSAE